MEKEYRYMIWNAVKAEFQFPRICETTEKGATTCLFNCIGNDARKDRFQIKKVEKEKAKQIVKELKQKLKEANKGINSLIQSRRKWKHRYYKMKNKNKDLQKSVEQIYNDYQDIGKMAFDYSDKIEEQDKIINLMASEILVLDIKRANDTHDKARIWETEEGVIQYFENKAKEN